MPTLHLLRHAKSSWDDPSLPDHDRPLAPRGVRACAVIARHLREQGIDPDLILCSTAVRARETLAGIRDGLVGSSQTAYEPAIYEASATALLEVLRRTPVRSPSSAAGADEPLAVMLIGHQPGIGELATTLAASGDRLPVLAAKFPTAALATLEFGGPWSEIAPGCARLTGFVKPKELARAG